MKLIATIDYWDGTPGKVRVLHSEDFVGNGLALMFTHPNVATITITRPPNLAKTFKLETTEGNT